MEYDTYSIIALNFVGLLLMCVSTRSGVKEHYNFSWHYCINTHICIMEEDQILKLKLINA